MRRLVIQIEESERLLLGLAKRKANPVVIAGQAMEEITKIVLAKREALDAEGRECPQ